MSRQHMVVDTTTFTAASTTNTVTASSAVLAGMQVGTDSANDPTITVYDGTDNTGNVIVPTTEYDATALGLNGFIGAYDKRAYNGIFVEVSIGGGSVEVTIDYRNT